MSPATDHGGEKATAGHALPRRAGRDRLRRNHLVISMAIAGAAAALIAVLSYGLMLDPKRVPPANLSKAALPFSVPFVQGQDILKSPDGAPLTLANLAGRPAVLNFWASWCVSCREEAHELQAFWSKHKDEILVVGIAIQDQQEAAKKFATYFGKTYPLGLDEDGKAGIDYGVSGVPETFLIDKSGKIVEKIIGPVTAAKLESLLPLVR